MTYAKFLIIFLEHSWWALNSEYSNYKLDNTNDPLKWALRYFENQPSITNIKSKSFEQNFTFRDTSSSEPIKPIQRYSQEKTGVSLSSVQEWLVSCFWSFSYVYTIN